MQIGRVWPILKESFHEWQEDKAPRLGAALSYYTTFSLAPLLILVTAVAGLVFGVEAAQGKLMEEIGRLVGKEGADVIQSMVSSAQKNSTGGIAAVIGLGALLFGASGVFGQLQDALNTIWEVKPKPGAGIMKLIKDRFFSFGLVLGLGFLFLVSLTVSTALTAVQAATSDVIPGPEFVGSVLNFIAAFAVITLIFATLFKYLPDATISWRVALGGAAVTTVLFIIGKTLIGLYLGKSDAASSYGVAGSFIVILLWVYYSAQIFLFGGEITQVYAKERGEFQVEPDAELIDEEERSEQGISPSRSSNPESSHRGRHGVNPTRTSEESPRLTVPWGTIALVGVGTLIGKILGRKERERT